MVKIKFPAKLRNGGKAKEFLHLLPSDVVNQPRQENLWEFYL